MNALVALAGEPALMRNSLILIGADVAHLLGRASRCASRRWSGSSTARVPTRSPLKAAGPEVTLNVALALAPGATGPAIVAVRRAVPLDATAVHCALGTAMLSWTPVAGAPMVLVNVTVVSCDDPGENVCSPGGAAVGRRRRQAQARDVVLRRDDVGLHQLIGGVGRERARRRHRAFVERPLRADAVVAAVAEQDRALLAHRVVGVSTRGPSNITDSAPSCESPPIDVQ